MRDVNGIELELGDMILNRQGRRFFVHASDWDFRDGTRNWYVSPCDDTFHINCIEGVGPFTIEGVTLRQRQQEFAFARQQQ